MFVEFPLLVKTESGALFITLNINAIYIIEPCGKHCNIWVGDFCYEVVDSYDETLLRLGQADPMSDVSVEGDGEVFEFTLETGGED